MSFASLLVNQVGQEVLMTGNEAVARGALEAGIGYASSYPGSPTAEILDNLGHLAQECGFYAEWSVNEKVALEGAAAASFAGLRSLCVMKPNGLNVALDSVTSVAMSGIKAGLVLVVGDDPAGHSSTNEEDSRYLEKLAHLPVLEPSTPREAKEMTLAAFELSEKIKIPVALRCVTRVCHAGGNVTVGEIKPVHKKPAIDHNERFITVVFMHAVLETKLNRIRTQVADGWPFNRYTGPPNAGVLIITAGVSFMYAKEAVKELGLSSTAGIFKLGISWPLPENKLLEYLKTAEKVIFLEEVEPFVEENVMHLAAQHINDIYPVHFFGQKSGHVAGPSGPGIGEMTPETVTRALAAACEINVDSPREREKSGPISVPDVPARELAFCPGCPHRASFWAVKSALAIDGRNGIVLGDIGCYTMGLGRTGFHLLQTVHAMGSGAGMADALGKLSSFGFDQPVISLVGDSTFYHAVIPALLNARYGKSNFLLIVLDNETTAMTGHQPHPGMDRNIMGIDAERISIESVVEGLGIPVTIHDPYDVAGTTRVVFELLQNKGVKVLILRRTCALVAFRKAHETPKQRVYVDGELCIGESCGCARFCNQTFSCPALIWNAEKKQALIDEAVCSRCQVCTSICPRGAIKVERGEKIGS